MLLKIAINDLISSGTNSQSLLIELLYNSKEFLKGSSLEHKQKITENKMKQEGWSKESWKKEDNHSDVDSDSEGFLYSILHGLNLFILEDIYGKDEAIRIMDCFIAGVDLELEGLLSIKDGMFYLEYFVRDTARC